MSIPGTWPEVSAVTLLVFIVLGAIAVAVEKPLKRWMAKRRLRKLRRQPIPAPWDGAIVRQKQFTVTNWSAAVGRAYRA